VVLQEAAARVVRVQVSQRKIFRRRELERARLQAYAALHAQTQAAPEQALVWPERWPSPPARPAAEGRMPLALASRPAEQFSRNTRCRREAKLLGNLTPHLAVLYLQTGEQVFGMDGTAMPGGMNGCGEQRTANLSA
jgi:hypothetical protein